MALWPIASQSSDEEFDDRHFRQIVFDFIDRIGKEIVLYNDYESNLSANDFKHIELQVHAQRVQKVLKLCIEKIRLIFYVSHLIQHQSDHLMLLFSLDDAQFIENFGQKWFHSVIDSSDNKFISELSRCFDILKTYDTTEEWQNVND